jgi:hypothetical protein
MREILTFGLMRGCWKRSDGPLEGDTHPKGEKRLGLARPVRHRASALLYSPMAGHAMKVDDPFKALGAMPGKAFWPLKGGQD